MKTIIFLVWVIAMIICLNACSPAYVVEQPVYLEAARPPSPANDNVWIDGDWVWNRQTHSYVKRNGYWEAPKQGRTFVTGHWQKTKRGNYWVAGHWR